MNMQSILIILAIISLIIMTVFMVVGIVMILKEKPGKKFLITGMVLGIVPVVLVTILLFMK